MRYKKKYLYKASYNKTMKFNLLYLIPLIFLISCDLQGVGPCVHIYEEPILSIVSVSDEDHGNEISQITISDIYIDDEIQNPLQLVDQTSTNVAVEDSLIICSVPCGFSTREGNYQFTVYAEGYNEATISAEANYGTSEGGCPSTSSDGTTISFTLVEE